MLNPMSRSSRRRVFFAAAALVLAVVPSTAGEFANGDPIAAFATGLGANDGLVSWYRDDGSVIQLAYFANEGAGGMAFDAAGRLLVSRAHDIVVVLPTQQLGGTFADDLSHKTPRAIVIDSAGFVYVGTPAPPQV